MTSISKEMSLSYKIPLLIFGIIVTFFTFVEISNLFESSILTRIAIVVSPLAVSICCFIISKMYGNSKVFGKSYFLLGMGFFSTFIGEVVFFHYVDSLGYEEYEILGESIIFISYPLMMAHIIINIRYFTEKLKKYQKFLLISIPIVIILGYSIITGIAVVDIEEFYYYLIFVSASSIVLGLAVVAFTLFRQSVLISAWFVLLIGIVVGTIGDILYNYAYTLGIYSFSDFSNILWIVSPLIIIYALYKHQKSI